MMTPDDIDIETIHIDGADGPRTVVRAKLEVNWETVVNNQLLAQNPAAMKDVEEKLRRHIWDSIYDSRAFRVKANECIMEARRHLGPMGDHEAVMDALRPLLTHYDMPRAAELPLPHIKRLQAMMEKLPGRLPVADDPAPPAPAADRGRDLHEAIEEEMAAHADALIAQRFPAVPQIAALFPAPAPLPPNAHDGVQPPPLRGHRADMVFIDDAPW